jgi:hypothetical protein
MFNSRVPSLQVWSLEFTPHSHQKTKKQFRILAFLFVHLYILYYLEFW